MPKQTTVQYIFKQTQLLTIFTIVAYSKQVECHGYHGTQKIQNPLLRKAHLTTLNLNNFKIIEAMRLKIIASRSP
jgi:hypothetical protein